MSQEPTKTCTTCTGWIRRRCHNAKTLGRATKQPRPVRGNCKLWTGDARQLEIGVAS
jgi:hypothetical protein